MKEKIQNTKNSKGITLVALIITIVVLLILAVVAIGSLQESNIIGHAQNAAEGYNAEKIKEEGTLANYVNTIEENIPKGKEKGITINKLLNKAYTAEVEGNMAVYYITQEDGRTYINCAIYDIATGEDVTDEYEGGGQPLEITLTNEFEDIINIVINGSAHKISNQNALKSLGSTFGSFFITQDAMYAGIGDGEIYNNMFPGYVRNANYDSYINN